jgi:hypothetical protein
MDQVVGVWLMHQHTPVAAVPMTEWMAGRAMLRQSIPASISAQGAASACTRGFASVQTDGTDLIVHTQVPWL